MNKTEYNRLNEVDVEREEIISINDLVNKKDRTLLYGYTCSRNRWHVYIQNNEIYTTTCRFDDPPQEIEVESNQHYVPDKRLNPERCDFEFCKRLIEKGINLPFTTWKDEIESDSYYGKTL